MGDAITIVAMLTVFIWSWRVMAARWRARDYRWWVRHPAAFVLSSCASIAVLLLSLGLGIAPPAGDAATSTAGAVFSALIIASPLLIALWTTRSVPNRPTTVSAVPQSDRIPPKKVPFTRIQSTPPRQNVKPQVQAHSGNLKFIYEDAQGNMSAREVSGWRETNTYIEGYCLAAGDVRTFRKDRILRFISGNELLQIGSISQSKATQKPKVSKIEILFTGFSSGDRAELEKKAQTAGMLVRKSVTRNLHYLCAGENAGPNKISEAEDAGTTIIDESEFNDLLELGLVPGQ